MKSLALRLLQLYKRWISPAFPPSCRFVPTCSEYAMEAVERYGALRGGMMAAWRVLRCHPLAKAGYDPAVKDPVAKDKDDKDKDKDRDNDQNRGQLCPRHTGLIASD